MHIGKGLIQDALKALVTVATALAFSGAYASSGGLPADVIADTGAYQARLIKSKDNVAVIELTGNYDRNLGGQFNAEPRAVIAREFYKRYADRYDILLVFSTFEYNSGDALAFYHGVRNDVRGIGESLFDHSASYGSRGKLQGFIDMAAMSRYSLEPSSPQFEAVLSTIAHEFLHRWAAYVKYRAADGSASKALLGRDSAHWSFLLDTGGSVEYGHRWQDNGNGSFTSVDARQLYSPLDLYLMGMLKKEEVPPFFLINSQDVDPTRLPQIGVTVKGSKVPVTIDDIIAVEGERQPDATQSQKEFEFGLILLTRAGEVVTDEQIQAANRVRQTFQTRLGVMTGGRLIARASLQPKGLTPAASAEQSEPELANTSPASISTALNWLKTHQSAAGYWQDNEGTRLRDTTVALAALRQQAGTDSQQSLAQGWIGEQIPQSTDYLARRILELEVTQTLEDQQGLLVNQNSDGGWGIAPGYQSNPIDTALAAQALARNASPGAATARNKALYFLQQQQNADGGWGSAKGGISRTYASALALNTLSDSAERPPREKAAAFLKSRQNADGGFGDSPSTVHDTANVLSALSTTGFADQIDINAAKRFLNATQKSDGSWDGSAYSTALALNVLGAAGGGNWTLSEFTATPDSPYDGQRIRLSVRVWNKGTQATPSTVLRYYDGDPKAGGQAIGNNIVVPAMAPGEGLLRETLWDTTNRAGVHSLYAYVDPQAQAVESNRGDNHLKTELTVAPAREGLDFALFNTDLLVTPTRVNRLPTAVTITAQISNLGKADAGAVKVALLDSAGVQVIDQQTVILLGRSTVPVTFSLALNKAGASRYQIVIDPSNVTTDEDRRNNTLVVDIPVDPTVDVQVLATDIQTPPGNPPTLLGSDVDFKFRVSNSGTADSAPFQAVYSLSNGTEARELGRPQLQLQAGQYQDYTLRWRADLSGELTLKIQLDPLATLSETERGNNQATSASFTVTAANGANLAVSYHDLSASPSPALEGRELKLSGIVRNTGNQNATNIEVGFYEGDPAKGGILVAPLQTLPSLAAGAESNVQAIIPHLKGSQDRLYFLAVDPAHKQTELTRDDNSTFISANVSSMADLVVSATDILTTPAQPKAGESVTLDVGITNLGSQAAEPFVVRLYEGSPAQGKQIGNDMPVAALEGLRSARVSFQTTLPAQGNVIEYTVVADPLEQVSEQMRSNNSATKILSLQASDSYVTERYFSPNGDGIKDVTRFGFKLSNAGPYRVQVLDALNKLVREISPGLSGGEGQVEWDGKDEFGKVLDDGVYRFELRDKTDVVVTQQSIKLDNNRVPILRAMGTGREVYKNLTCSEPSRFSVAEALGVIEGTADGKYIGVERNYGWGNGFIEVLDIEAGKIRSIDLGRAANKLKKQDPSLVSIGYNGEISHRVYESPIGLWFRIPKSGNEVITIVENVTRVFDNVWTGAPSDGGGGAQVYKRKCRDLGDQY